MKNKLFILIPTLFLTVSCGTATDAKVRNANNEEPQYYVATQDELEKTYISAFKNIITAKKTFETCRYDYFENGLFYTGGVGSTGHQGVQEDHVLFAYYDVAKAFEYEEDSSYWIDGIYSGKAFYKEALEFNKAPIDETTYNSYVETFRMSIYANGNVDSTDTGYAFNKCDPLVTYEDSLASFENYHKQVVICGCSSFLADFIYVSPMTYYKEGNKIIFVANEVSFVSTDNPDYSSDHTLPEELEIVVKYTNKYIFEKKDNEYYFCGYNSNYQEELMYDRKGNLYHEPEIIFEYNDNYEISYTTTEEYQKKNFIDYDFSAVGFSPVATYYTDMPKNKWFGDPKVSSTVPLSFYNDTIATKRAIEIPDDIMVLSSEFALYADDLFAFSTDYEYNELGYATNNYEVVDLTGGAIETVNLSDGGVIIKALKNIIVMVKFEIKAALEYGKVTNASIQRVTFIPIF